MLLRRSFIQIISANIQTDETKLLQIHYEGFIKVKQDIIL